MKRPGTVALILAGATLAASPATASELETDRLSIELDRQAGPSGPIDTGGLEHLQPGDRLDLELYQRGQVSRFGIRREIVRIGNREFIIDDQDRMIIHISVY